MVCWNRVPERRIVFFGGADGVGRLLGTRGFMFAQQGPMVPISIATEEHLLCRGGVLVAQPSLYCRPGVLRLSLLIIRDGDAFQEIGYVGILNRKLP